MQIELASYILVGKELSSYLPTEIKIRSHIPVYIEKYSVICRQIVIRSDLALVRYKEGLIEG